MSLEEVHVGPTPVKALGATDQHSQLQLYREGPNDKLFTLLQIRHYGRELLISPPPDCAPELDYLAGTDMGRLLDAERLATEYALIRSARPCMTVIFDTVDAFSIGQFIYLYETTTSIAAMLFGIDAYNQPAVELGKLGAFALMGRAGYEDLAGEMQPFAEIDGDYLV